MGWTCQHDFKGECKLLSKPCLPGIKGCILNKSEYTFSSGSYEEDKKRAEVASAEPRNDEIDFAALARNN